MRGNFWGYRLSFGSTEENLYKFKDIPGLVLWSEGHDTSQHCNTKAYWHDILIIIPSEFTALSSCSLPKLSDAVQHMFVNTKKYNIF